MSDFKKTIDEYITHQSTVYLSADNTEMAFESRIKFSKDDRIYVENNVPFTMIAQFKASNHFQIQIGAIKIKSDNIDTDGKHLIFPTNHESASSNTRKDERFAFLENEQVICEFVNPVDNKTLISKQVLDLSDSGASIRCEYSSKLFTEKRELKDITIKIDGTPYKKIDGNIVYSRKLFTLNKKIHLQVGISFNA